jgi:hypothetical protein
MSRPAGAPDREHDHVNPMGSKGSLDTVLTGLDERDSW